MLYNPTWKPARDIHSLDSLIKWLGTKRRWGWYKYTDCQHCLLAQYFTDMGIADVMVSTSTYWGYENGERVSRFLPEGWDQIAQGFLFGTFGGALKRAKRLRAAQRSISVPVLSLEDQI